MEKRGHISMTILTNRDFRNVIILTICSIFLGWSCSVVRRSYDYKPKPAPKISFKPRQSHIPEDRAVIPFELAKYAPLIEVYVDGQGPYSFVLDTGSTGIMLSRQLVVQIKPPIIPVEVFMHTSSRRFSLGKARHIGLIKIGPAEFSDVDVCVGKLDQISKAVSRKIDGVLGMQVFANTRLTIDYRAQQLVLERPEKAEPFFSEDPNVLPVKLMKKGLVSVPLKINERILWCMIDTGKEAGITLGYEYARIFPLTTPLASQPSTVMTFSGVIQTHKSQLKGFLRLGSHELSNPKAAFQRGTASIVGAGVLKHYVVTIDQQAMMVRFM
jgi:predicted aspartyl protease